MAKANKTFTVQKRFMVNVATKVAAESFEKAVEEGKKLETESFFKINAGTDLYDCEQLPGFGVNEDY